LCQHGSLRPSSSDYAARLSACIRLTSAEVIDHILTMWSWDTSPVSARKTGVCAHGSKAGLDFVLPGIYAPDIALQCHSPVLRQYLCFFLSSTWGRADQHTSLTQTESGAFCFAPSKAPLGRQPPKPHQSCHCVSGLGTSSAHSGTSFSGLFTRELTGCRCMKLASNGTSNSASLCASVAGAVSQVW
jgi:hypothetical protein